MLDLLTVVLMLLAGLLHASWHSLVKYGSDQVLVLAGMGLVAAMVAACALPFLPVPSAPAWAVIVGSVFLHVGYKLALARSYVLGDLGQAYPLARGFVPLFSTIIAFALLGQSPSAGQIFGIVLVSLGLIWLSAHSIHGGVDRRLFLAALAAGATVAGYSVADAYGTRLDGNWAAFTAWLIIADTVSFSLLIYWMRGPQLWRDLWRFRAKMVVAGLLGVVSFSVFLWALSRSPVGAVSALRESSVLFATLIGVAVHGEKPSLHKTAAAALIAAGLITIAAMR
jgi:drug/metabolite transporter (DMT)-like permease